MYQFLSCTILYPDLAAALDRLAFPDTVLATFQARCGRPPLTPEELPETGPGTVMGSLCLSGLSPESSDFSLCSRGQCLYHFCGRSLVNSLQEEGGYLMTPGWLRQWKDRIRDWGFDRLTAGDFFRDTARKLVLLDTGSDPESIARLGCMARYLDRPHQVIQVGLEHLELTLDREYSRFRYQRACRQKETAEKLAADHALVQDILNQLPGTVDAAAVVNALKELFTLLAAPESITYIPVERFATASPAQASTAGTHKAFMDNTDQSFRVDPEGTGFYLKIFGSQSLLGLLVLEKLAFPEHMTHYLNIGLNVSGMFGLAIEHVRMVETLMDASLAAGKAELATEMLHNVGNILNSVNISAEEIFRGLEDFSGSKITAVADLVRSQSQNLAAFFSTDPRGVKLPVFLEKLAEKIETERLNLIREINSQLKKVKIIGDIISTQQEIAGCKPIEAKTDMIAVVEESLKIMDSRIKTCGIDIVRDYHPLPPINSQRGKLVQILLNLLSNAVDALAEVRPSNRQIQIRLAQTLPDRISLEITDTGVGMAPEVLGQVFTYGFSTKKDGHGFGLHNAANLATQLKGHLCAQSPGIGKGSTFILTLAPPVLPKGRKIISGDTHEQTHPYH